jgi:hypothetical protein
LVAVEPIGLLNVGAELVPVVRVCASTTFVNIFKNDMVLIVNYFKLINKSTFYANINYYIIVQGLAGDLIDRYSDHICFINPPQKTIRKII